MPIPDNVLTLASRYNTERFEKFVDQYGIDDTQRDLKQFLSRIRVRLSDPDLDTKLRKSLGKLQHRLDSKLILVNGYVKDANREETHSVQSVQRTYGELAYRLATELIKYAPIEVLQSPSRVAP